MPLSSRLRHCSPPSPHPSLFVCPHPSSWGCTSSRTRLTEPGPPRSSPTCLAPTRPFRYHPTVALAALTGHFFNVTVVHLCNDGVTSNVSASAQVRATQPVTPMLPLPPLSRGVQGMKVDDIETRFRSAVSATCPHFRLYGARPLMALWAYAVSLLVFSPPPSSSASTTTAGTRARRLRQLCWRTGRRSRRPVVLCTQHTPQQPQCVSVACTPA
jgi:hypothetical protein